MFDINHTLYVILDTEVIDRNNLNIFKLANTLSRCEADIFQLRAKNLADKDFLSAAVKLAKIFQSKNKTFIINNRVDIAYLCKANGVHLGKDDIPPYYARKILGRKNIIGKTVHSLKELTAFQKEDIDYMSAGPMFKTQIKPNLPPLEEKKIHEIFKKSKKTIFAIGGINLYNIPHLTKLCINNIAVCQGVILSKNLKNTVKKFKRLLQ